eukprot:TRINITY_DN9911_c0_g1_i1.p1 TRINITY_DN9911_c0_g1~~TRINITY_DN9911_c0_g1_i1.p1  ORF type:complete len:352 (-),score=34.30 TRINITY_DN9911_c0_g1_i1:57-1088(-)
MASAYLWFLWTAVFVPFVAYCAVIIYKQLTLPQSELVSWKIKLMDPFVQLIFFLPWGTFRKLENLGAMKTPRKSIHSVKDITIPGVDENNPIPARIYHPNAQQNLPVVMYFHGGGFAIGSIESSDHICRDLSDRIGCIFISINYRLAPEHKFPHGFNDAYKATKWAYENARSFGGDPSRMAVMGESAGGNFAAGVCLRNSLSNTEDFRLVHQVLVYPSSDLRPTPVRPSRAQFRNAWFYGSRQSDKFRVAYVDDLDDLSDYRASPFVYNGSMERVPNAFVLVSQLDPLRDEGYDYAKKLKESKVDVKVNTYKATHGFFEMQSEETERALKDVTEVLTGVFSEV